LEIEEPSIPAGLANCVRRGATRITVLLNFLNSGRHVLEDVPRIVAEFGASHAGVECRLTPRVGSHPQMDSLYLDLIK
jgi:sirohydrochlorin ferrochelatase